MNRAILGKLLDNIICFDKKVTNLLFRDLNKYFYLVYLVLLLAAHEARATSAFEPVVDDDFPPTIVVDLSIRAENPDFLASEADVKAFLGSCYTALQMLSTCTTPHAERDVEWTKKWLESLGFVGHDTLYDPGFVVLKSCISAKGSADIPVMTADLTALSPVVFRVLQHFSHLTGTSATLSCSFVPQSEEPNYDLAVEFSLIKNSKPLNLSPQDAGRFHTFERCMKMALMPSYESDSVATASASSR